MIRFAYHHPKRDERGEVEIAVIPDGTIPTMTASNADELHDAPQYCTEIRSCTSSCGLLDNEARPESQGSSAWLQHRHFGVQPSPASARARNEIRVATVSGSRTYVVAFTAGTTRR